MFNATGKYEIKGDQLIIEAEPQKDFFVDPVTGNVTANAVFVYKEVTGDFVCRAKVSLAHQAKFDAGVLLAMQDETHWAKACFEMGDYGFTSICTVMTNGLSDDSNGVTVEKDAVWLQLARTGNVFSVHYSLDGANVYLARICAMPFAQTLKVGFVGQSPTGNGGKRCFSDFSIENRGLADPRRGQ